MKIKKVLKSVYTILLSLPLVFSPYAASSFAASSSEVQWPDGVSVDTQYAIVMDISSGGVLYEKNADEQNYPASITKIMTALLVVENCKLTDTVTFSSDAINKTEGSGIARDYGERMSVADCLYGMMLESSNECAYALAEYAGDGDYDAFIEMMNKRAARLGCTNTHFTNSSGLHDDNHYTSCRDMALIAAEAYKNDTFRNIVGTRYYEIPATNKHSEPTELNNHHAMFSDYTTDDYLYDYCTGGKTGYTSNSNYTLVTYAEHGGMSLVCVVMNCLDEYGHYRDTTTLFDFCFNSFTAHSVESEETRISTWNTETDAEVSYLFGKDDSLVSIDDEGVIVLPNGADFSDTEYSIREAETAGDIIGYVDYTYFGRDVGSVEITASGGSLSDTGFATFENVESEDAEEALEKKEQPETLGGRIAEFVTNHRRVVIRIAVVAAAGVVAFILWFFLRRYVHRDRWAKYKKIKKRRK